MSTTTVKLGNTSYPIIIAEGTYRDLPAILKSKFPDASSFFLITNQTLASLFSTQLIFWKQELNCDSIAIPDGEKYKTIDTWNHILDAMLKSRIDRSAVAIAFGGGVIGDMTGFAAASVLRGIRYVQIPTTLLAMVDSSVGGKTGVNHTLGKNLIGAFCQPSLVWVDPSYCATLSQREFIAGAAEIFKYAFIGGTETFEFILRKFDDLLLREPEVLFDAITRSIAIKSGIVERDEKESGERALLNFGHTFGHALETFCNYTGILHGEAVLFGIRCACELGKKTKTIKPEYHAAYDTLNSHLPGVTLPVQPSAKQLYENMFADKKCVGKSLRFILPTDPGTSIISSDVTEAQVIDSINSVLAAW